MEPVPGLTRESFVVFVCRQLWSELPQVLGHSLLFSLCCAPAFVFFSLGLLVPTVVVGVVTIAPGWVALLAVQRNIVSNGVFPALGFGTAWRRYWRRSTLLGMLAAFPFLAALATLPALQQPAVPLVVWIGLGADLFGMALLAAILLYAFPLLVHFDYGVKDSLRDGWILAARFPAHTLGLLGFGILGAFAVSYFSLGLLLLLPALYGLFVVGNSLLVLQTTE